MGEVGLTGWSAAAFLGTADEHFTLGADPTRGDGEGVKLSYHTIMALHQALRPRINNLQV